MGYPSHRNFLKHHNKLQKKAWGGRGAPALGFWVASVRPSSRHTARRADSLPLMAVASRRQLRSCPWRKKRQRRSGGAPGGRGGGPSALGGLGKGANSQVGSEFWAFNRIPAACPDGPSWAGFRWHLQFRRIHLPSVVPIWVESRSERMFVWGSHSRSEKLEVQINCEFLMQLLKI